MSTILLNILDILNPSTAHKSEKHPCPLATNDMSGSHRGVYKDDSLVGYCTVSVGQNRPDDGGSKNL
jgi:hypothetical protein